MKRTRRLPVRRSRYVRRSRSVRRKLTYRKRNKRSTRKKRSHRKRKNQLGGSTSTEIKPAIMVPRTEDYLAGTDGMALIIPISKN